MTRIRNLLRRWFASGRLKVTDSIFGLPSEEFGWEYYHLRPGLSFTMPDGHTAYLLVESKTPCVWIAILEDKTGVRLTQEFILECLNNPTVKED